MIWTVDEFNESAAMVGTRELSFDEIVRVKKKRSELFQQWSAVEPGATLELQFEAAVLTEPSCAGTRLTVSVFSSLTRLKKYAG